MLLNQHFFSFFVYSNYLRWANHKLYNGYFLFDSNTMLVYNQMVTM